MKELAKGLNLWFIIGMVYFTIEGFWRIKDGGWSNITMLFVGGLCGLIIGYINEIPKFYNMKIYMQAIIGALITLLIEFISGCILNILLDMNIWDYSNRPFNIMGQVCLGYGIIWFFLMPAAIWLDDYLRFIIFDEGEWYSPKEIYIEFFTGK